MKCRRCREPAVIDVRRHNAAFCKECFLHHCREQVRKAISEYDMLAPGERVLVAISGGKDSLAAWHVLLELGYQVDGLYLGLGIGDYSDESGVYTRGFASARGLRLREIDLRGGVRGKADHAIRTEEPAHGLRREIVLADSTEDVVARLTSSDDASTIGRAAHERILSAHTADHRAAELERYIEEAAHQAQPADLIAAAE